MDPGVEPGGEWAGMQVHHEFLSFFTDQQQGIIQAEISKFFRDKVLVRSQGSSL